MKKNVKSKTVSVTGGTQGLGRALCNYFASAGYTVFVGYHSHKEKALTVLDEIASHGGTAFAVGGDISEEQDVKNIFADIEAQAGSLDLLINNACFSVGSYLHSTQPDYPGEVSHSRWWDMNLDVSLKGTYLCCLYGMELMRKQSSGVIINISSIRGIVPNDFNFIPYGAAKAGQISLTRSFAKLGAEDNIRVNALLPGAIHTEILDTRTTKERREQVCAGIPLKRMASMDEVCHAAMFLASNTYMTGATLDCNGGWLMN